LRTSVLKYIKSELEVLPEGGHIDAAPPPNYLLNEELLFPKYFSFSHFL
jgi:hypothetical protein